MKFITLQNILGNKANDMRLSAAYSGAWDDGGASYLLNSLIEYKNELAVKYDLRPSELHKIDDMDVGEPQKFNKYIEEYKISLAKKIKL